MKITYIDLYMVYEYGYNLGYVHDEKWYVHAFKSHMVSICGLAV